VEWERLHKLILRATSDEESERFPDFEAFANAAYGTIVPQPITPREAGSSYSEKSKRLVRKKIPAWARRRIIVGVAIVAFLLTSLSGFYINRLLRPAVVETIDGGLIKNPRTSGEFFYNARILSERGEIQQAVDQYSKLFASGGCMRTPLTG